MQVGEIVNGISNLLIDDGSANYEMLHEGLGTTSEVIGSVIGILVMILIIGIPIMVALEVCYINFPILQNRIDRISEASKGADKFVGFIFRDARLTLYNTDTGKSDRNRNSEYFHLKIKNIIIAYVCVAIVLGPGNLIIQYIAFAVQHVIQSLS